MASCLACGAEVEPTESSCGQCGTSPTTVPDLELSAVPRRSAPAVRARPPEDLTIELAFDPRPSVGLEAPGAAGRTGPQKAALRDSDPLASDARLLADYGDPGRHWTSWAVYAYRVLQRRRQLKRALSVRSDEATRAAAAVQSALVTLGERVRPRAEPAPAYAKLIAALREAESHLSSRDRMLAAEHDQQATRLSAIDVHLSTLERDLVQAQGEYRNLTAERSRLEGAVARSEAELKQVDDFRVSTTPRETRRTRE